jgi:hypothetical protein
MMNSNDYAAKMEALVAKMEAEEAAMVANGTCHWYEIELCFPQIGCNKYFRRACKDRADAMKRGRAIARTFIRNAAGIRVRRTA